MLGLIKFHDRYDWGGPTPPISINKSGTKVIYTTMGREIKILDITNYPKIKNEDDRFAFAKIDAQYYKKHLRGMYEPVFLNVNWNIYRTNCAFYYKDGIIIAKMGQGNAILA